MSDAPAPRPDQRSTADRSAALKAFQFNLFTKLEGAVTSAMVHLGDALGLYRVLAEHGRPMTTEALAAAAELHPRWVREWVRNQVAARLLDGDDDLVAMSAEGVAVLADPANPAFGMGMFHRLPQTMQATEHVKDSFRTGLGHDYDSHGEQGAVGIERSFEPWFRANLLSVVLPALDGVTARLSSGARLADVGCGAGGAALMIAAAYPASHVAGYDISQHALARARQRLAERGLDNVEFHDPRVRSLPDDHSLDVVTTFDCIHDMAHPQPVIEAIHAALRPDGTWLLADIKALDSFALNVAKNPMASMMYGISVLSCMSSAMSEPDGAGLGTLGLPESKAREMAAAAGFARFRRLDVEHPINAFFEIRP